MDQIRINFCLWNMEKVAKPTVFPIFTIVLVWVHIGEMSVSKIVPSPKFATYSTLHNLLGISSQVDSFWSNHGVKDI